MKRGGAGEQPYLVEAKTKDQDEADSLLLTERRVIKMRVGFIFGQQERVSDS